MLIYFFIRMYIKREGFRVISLHYYALKVNERLLVINFTSSDWTQHCYECKWWKESKNDWTIERVSLS